MNILIIDGNPNKAVVLSKQLCERDSNIHTNYKDNYSDAARFIDEYHESIDMIVLDWSFPFRTGMRNTYGIGALLLDYLDESNYNIKTFLYTSDTIDMEKNQCSFVAGVINWCSEPNFIPSIDNIFPDKIDVKSKYSKCIKKPDTSRSKYTRKKGTPWWM